MKLHGSVSGGLIDPRLSEGLEREVPFSEEECYVRAGGVRTWMRKRGVEVFVATDPANVLYLSGYQTFSPNAGECVIVTLEAPPTLIVPPIELGGTLIHSWLIDRRGYPSHHSRMGYIATMLKLNDFADAMIALEMQLPGLSAVDYEEIQRVLPKAAFTDGSWVVRDVKKVKSQTEITQIRRAAAVTDMGIAAAVETAREGATDNQIAAAASEVMLRMGSEYMCISPVVTSGRRSGILHSTHKRNWLRKGDVVLLEMGACFHRYSAPTMRTVFIGEPPEEARRMADACLRALDNVLNAMRPGVSAHEVAEAGWEGISAAGDDFVFHGNFGYSVGAGLPPSWADGAADIVCDVDTILEPGMVFHHPIALRRMGQYGTAFSETSVVTKNGCEVLTSSPREIIVR